MSPEQAVFLGIGFLLGALWMHLGHQLPHQPQEEEVEDGRR